MDFGPKTHRGTNREQHLHLIHPLGEPSGCLALVCCVLPLNNLSAIDFASVCSPSTSVKIRLC